MIPDKKLSSQPIVSEFLHPDELFDYCMQMVDYELGGVALNDPSQGFLVYVWRVRIVGLDIIIDAPDVPEIEPVVLLTTTARASSVTLAFDQNMNPALAYVELGVGKFWWYDSNIPGQTTTILGPGVLSPRTFLDDKRTRQTLTSDILLFYLRDGALYFRAQRDRFTIEYWLKDTAAIGIARQGMNSGSRVQIELVYALGYGEHNACGFEDLNNQVPSTLVTSNRIVLNGFISLQGEAIIYNGEYRVRENVYAEWSDWTNERGEVSPGNVVQLRTETPPLFGATKIVTIDLAGFICEWSVSTRAEVLCSLQFTGEACLDTSVECIRFSGVEC
jgi:hypothetical protein